jgi:hypothetical protein
LDPVVIHELGHLWEGADYNVHAETVAFLNRRTGRKPWGIPGEPEVKLNKILPNSGYDDDEVTQPDRFVDPYIGKRYAGDGYTEVISMGLQLMYEDPIRMAKDDPDYFNFIYAQMHRYQQR